MRQAPLSFLWDRICKVAMNFESWTPSKVRTWSPYLNDVLHFGSRKKITPRWSGISFAWIFFGGSKIPGAEVADSGKTILLMVIGVLFGCFAEFCWKIRWHWFTWWFNHLPGPSIHLCSWYTLGVPCCEMSREAKWLALTPRALCKPFCKPLLTTLFWEHER